MSNSASKQQCKLKRQMMVFKRELPRPTTTDLFTNTDFAEYNEASETFWYGPLRHGNNRRSIAKEKVTNRRTERKRNNRAADKQLRDEGYYE